jgi:hypothetical protein
MARSLLAILTDPVRGGEAIGEFGDEKGIELRVVVAAVEASPLRHVLGDVDEPKRQAAGKLETSVSALRAAGFDPVGEVGDPDPIQAAKDALLKAPADEVLIFEHERNQERWFEDGLLERAKEEIEPPLRMVILDTEADSGSEDGAHVVEVEREPAGTTPVGVEHEVGSAYLPGLSRADLAGIIAGIFGTIVAIILAAAAAAGSDGPETGWQAVAIGIAIAVALVNMAHVVGLVMMESVNYRGGFAKFFRTLSVVGTPLAVLINLAILLFA